MEQNVLEPIRDIQADYIIHAASYADPRSYALYPAETILINVIGVIADLI
jgi:dTDP-4-dehydrorhamnose reductase